MKHMKMVIQTTDGDFVAHYSAHGLARLEFPGGTAEPAATSEPINAAQARDWHALTVRALKEALAGRTPRVLPPLDLTNGTDFQRRVWNVLRRISSGRTRSYGEVAAGVGNTSAARAVGTACGANPIPVLVPCHRVLPSNRKLGGFSGGLDWKRKLLARENGNSDLFEPRDKAA